MTTWFAKYQITLRRLVVIAVLVVLALLPAILLFWLFGQLNSAVIEQTGLKLGGPVAAFFAVLYFLWKMYKEMRFADNPLEGRLQPLVGSWRIESKSAGSDRRASSGTNIELKDGELQITGGTFFAVGTDGSKGNAIGSWNAEMAVSDGYRLKYFYTLTDSLGSLTTSRGLVEAALEDAASEPTFRGTWQALGKEFHSGELTIKKQPTDVGK